jgi:hypothetical protein
MNTKISSFVKPDFFKGSYRVEIKVGRKTFRTEHVFSNVNTATAIAEQFVKAIKYSRGDKSAVGDHFVP